MKVYLITDVTSMKKALIALIVFFSFSVLGIAQPQTKPVKKPDAKIRVAPAAKTTAPEKTAQMPKSSANGHLILVWIAKDVIYN